MASVRGINRLCISQYISNKSRYFILPLLNISRNYDTTAKESFKFSDMQIEIATEAQKMRKPDVSKLAFGETFSDHMFEVEWNRNNGWGIPRIIPLHHFQFHPGSKIFHYGQAVFEGMKAFKYSNGMAALFRPDLNVKRLLVSAERASLPTFDAEEFLKCLKKLVSIDEEWIPCVASSSLYIRPTLIGTQNSLGVQSSNSALLYVITCPVGPYFPSGEMRPISLLADPNYVRAWPGGVGDKKMACNYAPSLYVQKLAQEQNLQQVLWLIGDNHKIAEVGAMNVFFFFQKNADQFELATPALDGTILPGVVRQSILELARGFNEFEVSERIITMDEVIAATEKKTLIEMFVCGTAVSVCPVHCIKFLHKYIQIPTMDRDRPLFQRIHKALTDIQYGRIDSEWSVKIQ